MAMVLDKRTSLSHTLREKEQELILSLSGDPSPQERPIIADTVKTMLFIGSLDHYLTGLKTLVHKGKVRPALIERTWLAGYLRENLKTLGRLQCRVKVETLADVVESEEENGEEQ